MGGAGDLLTPTLEEYQSREAAWSRPWQLGSQVYVAFFGGPLAVTAIAFLNARRLRAPTAVRVGIVALGAACLAGLLVLAGLGVLSDSDNLPRIGFTLAGLVAYGGMYLLQRPSDRIYRTFSRGTEIEEMYDPLIGPGLAAVVGGWIVQISLLAALV